jgi:cytoskeletal protein CcmA (bactofilin family)
MRILPSIVTSTLAALVLAATAGAQAPPTTASSQPVRADNYYAAGNHLVISAPMPADVVVAGREIEMAAPIAGDVLAAGWRVRLTAPADDDVRMAAGEVLVNAPVTGDLTVAGGDVTIGSQTHVNGRSWLTGRTVRVEGVLDRDVHVAGGDVQIGGEIRQPLEVVAERLQILPTARILGPFTYKGSTEARVADGALISSPIAYTHIPARDARRSRGFSGISSLLFASHLFLVGLLVVLFVPRAEASIIETLRRQLGKSVLAGFALLVTVPVASLMLIVSVLGLPIGLVLAAVYAVGLLASMVVAACFVGDLEARLLKKGSMATRWQQVRLLLAGVLTLALGRALLGGVVVFVSVLFGLGALSLWLYQTYGQTPAAPASA